MGISASAVCPSPVRLVPARVHIGTVCTRL